MPRKRAKTVAKPPLEGTVVIVDMPPPKSDVQRVVQSALEPRVVTYQSRIRIVEAWRYPGSLANAPEFIDRNWAAYADYDSDRQIEAGPALRLPARTPSGEKFARKGDYVVRQQVSLMDGIVDDVEVDIWPAEQFERLFLPVEQKPHRPFNPSPSPLLNSQTSAAPSVPEAEADQPDAGTPAAATPAGSNPASVQPSVTRGAPAATDAPAAGSKDHPSAAAGGNGDPRLPTGDEG